MQKNALLPKKDHMWDHAYNFFINIQIRKFLNKETENIHFLLGRMVGGPVIKKIFLVAKILSNFSYLKGNGVSYSFLLSS